MLDILEKKKTMDEYVKSGRAFTNNLADYKVAGLTTMTISTGQQFISGLTNGHDFDWQEVTNFSGSLGDGWRNPAYVIKEELERGNKPWQIIGDDSSHDERRVSNTDLQYCNKNFGERGTTQNCAKCSATLELRMRGFNVEAGRQSYPSSSDAPSLWFKDAKRIDINYEDAENALKTYEKGSSGILSYQYPNNSGGHAVHWTIDSSGQFQIQDGQNGRRFDSIKSMMDSYGGDKQNKITTYRLDNCEPNWDAMGQDSVIRLSEVEAGDAGSHAVKNKFNGNVVGRW